MKQGAKTQTNKPRIQPASNTRRILAFLIDWYAGSVLTSLPITFAYFQYTSYETAIMDVRLLPVNIAWISGIAAFLIACVYYIVVPYRLNGQTLGKKLMHIRIQEEQQSHITWRALWKRQLLGIILVEGSVYSISNFMMQLLLWNGTTMFVDGITYVHYAITIISIVLCLCRKQKKAIHDYLSHTQVVALG